jgi:NADH:ubiquinone oxidoreductase subunit E
MKIVICLGSACHMQGSMEVIERLQEHIQAEGLVEEAELSGCMCTGQCRRGVCVHVDSETFTVTPDSVDEFIRDQIDRRISK